VPTAAYNAAYDLLCDFLKKTREGNGVSQAQLASKLDVPQSYVSKYETGERRLDIVETLEICAALGVDGSTFVRELQSRVAKQKRTR
jgi:transcriptional regulator with XRE-family HTH domain